MIKRSLLAALAIAALCSASLAQSINTVPQTGLVTNVLKQPTYSATSIGLIPAASATDLFCISAGTSKTISIKQIKIAGTAGTAVTTPFLIYRRATLDTGGTPALTTALPVAKPFYTADPASNAVLTAYTANPTVNDSSPFLMDVILPTLAVTTTANSVSGIGSYGETIGVFTHGLVILKNTTQQICVNLNGVSVSSGVLIISMIWTENS